MLLRSSILYFADLVWGRPESLDLSTAGLQIGLFAVVALITGWLGDRVQRTWLALGEVQSELVRLRLDTGDILTNISTGVLTVVDGGRLGYLNKAGERFLDLTLEQWHGAPILDVVAEVAPGLADALRKSMNGLRPVSRQTASVRRPTGDLVLGISTTVLESREGEGPSVTAIFQDITDLERIQALNRRNERLEAVAELSASLGVCAAEAQAAGQDGSGVCGDVADWGHDGLGRGVADESGWLGGRREGRAGVPRSFHRRDGVGHGALRRPGGCAAA